ncbi:MAG: hypothetical protein NTV22_17065, partial [bacterium]|nr:hypothetical protein [bacterium]
QGGIAAMRQKGIGSNVVAWTAFNGLIRDEHDRYTVLITHSDGCIPSGIVAFNFFFSPTTPIPQLPDPAQ